MRINILVNKIAEGWEPNDTRLGGTEESVVQWASMLAEHGHTVTVFRNSRHVKDVLGTRSLESFLPSGKLFYEYREHYGQQYYWKPGICINIKSSEVSPKEPTIYLTNETNASALDLSQYDCVVWPSRWAKDNIPVNNEKVYVVPHGYDPNNIYPGKKVPKQCFYASSPDRGLEALLEAWPEVYEAHPDATLILTYGGKSDLPGIISLGECDEGTMNEVYQTSDIWCHPANGGELFCITGLKAQAAGCVPVIIPTMALSETVPFAICTDTPKDYAGTLKAVIGNDLLKENIRVNQSEYRYPTWKVSTDKLLSVIQKVLE